MCKNITLSLVPSDTGTAVSVARHELAPVLLLSLHVCFYKFVEVFVSAKCAQIILLTMHIT